MFGIDAKSYYGHSFPLYEKRSISYYSPSPDSKFNPNGHRRNLATISLSSSVVLLLKHFIALLLSEQMLLMTKFTPLASTIVLFVVSDNVALYIIAL